MASYQNTSGYYCGITVNTHPGLCPNPKVYFNQNPTNFHTHASAYYSENYKNQETFPETYSGGSTYNPTHRLINYNNGNVYGHVPHYNIIQNTPLTQQPVTYPVFCQEPRQHHNIQNMGRKHHAQITILPSSKGTFKAQIKRKRKRTLFTTEQVAALEDIFKTKKYINCEERLAIGNQLKLNDKAVKIWFQNRRLKVKRQDTEEQEGNSITDNSPEKSNSNVTAVLDSVETEINKKTDTNGFVSLDEGLVRDLVNVIDTVLTKNNLEVPLEQVVDSDMSSPYEPISPASVSDSNEEDSIMNWKPSDSNESLQRLFDLKNMLLL